MHWHLGLNAHSMKPEGKHILLLMQRTLPVDTVTKVERYNKQRTICPSIGLRFKIHFGAIRTTVCELLFFFGDALSITHALIQVSFRPVIRPIFRSI